jgi:hypothetical protein
MLNTSTPSMASESCFQTDFFSRRLHFLTPFQWLGRSSKLAVNHSIKSVFAT